MEPYHLLVPLKHGLPILSIPCTAESCLVPAEPSEGQAADNYDLKVSSENDSIIKMWSETGAVKIGQELIKKPRSFGHGQMFSLRNDANKINQYVLLTTQILKKSRIEGFGKILHVLGLGGYGVVLKMMQVIQRREEEIAVKLVVFKSAKEHAAYDAEAKIIVGLDHPNIVKHHMPSISPELGVYPMECLACNLSTLIANKPVNFQRIKKVALHVASALDYLHGKNLIHRDLKPSNILVEIDRDGNESFKIADFGCSKQVGAGIEATSLVGTNGFIAPEVEQRRPYDSKADIFSFGRLLYVMVTKQSASADLNWEDEFWDGAPAGLDELVQGCMDDEPELRPTAKGILASRFMKSA